MQRAIAVLLSVLLCALCTAAVLAEQELGTHDDSGESQGQERDVDWEDDSQLDQDDDWDGGQDTGLSDETDDDSDPDSGRGTTRAVASRSGATASTTIGLIIDEDDANEPSYMVRIPSTQELTLNGRNEVEITASGVAADRQVSVRFAGTNQDDRLIMVNNGFGHELYYSLLDAAGNTLVAGPDGAVGAELASFAQDGTQTYRIAIQTGPGAPAPVANADYVGTIFYEIALV